MKTKCSIVYSGKRVRFDPRPRTGTQFLLPYAYDPEQAKALELQGIRVEPYGLAARLLQDDQPLARTITRITFL
jgi:hypothetical protein